jgi:hypothetical protein
MNEEQIDRLKLLSSLKKSGEFLSDMDLDELRTLIALWNLEDMDRKDLEEIYIEMRVKQMIDDPKDLDDECNMFNELVD